MPFSVSIVCFGARRWTGRGSPAGREQQACRRGNLEAPNKDMSAGIGTRGRQCVRHHVWLADICGERASDSGARFIFAKLSVFRTDGPVRDTGHPK